jgi:hypothetical protein
MRLFRRSDVALASGRDARGHRGRIRLKPKTNQISKTHGCQSSRGFFCFSETHAESRELRRKKETNRMNRKLNAFFDPETEFEAEVLRGEPLKQAFAGLQETLVTETLDETQTLALHAPVKQAANEAAGLAWTTAFPLLVFPTLFEEKLDGVRKRQNRAERIKAQTANLLMEAVV